MDLEITSSTPEERLSAVVRCFCPPTTSEIARDAPFLPPLRERLRRLNDLQIRMMIWFSAQERSQRTDSSTSASGSSTVL